MPQVGQLFWSRSEPHEGLNLDLCSYQLFQPWPILPSRWNRLHAKLGKYYPAPGSGLFPQTCTGHSIHKPLRPWVWIFFGVARGSEGGAGRNLKWKPTMLALHPPNMHAHILYIFYRSVYPGKASVFLSMYLHIYASMYVHVSVHLHIYVSMRLCIYVSM